jgi:nicotinamidase-related amidase
MHQRLFPETSLLVIIDVQERLLSAVQNPQQIIFNVRRLLEGARLINVPVVISEQYPQGLGRTVKELIPYMPDGTTVLPKKSFSIYDDESIRMAIDSHQRSQVILCGVESHVCVLQSALDLLRAGREVYIVVDAIGSRFTDDQNMALRRLETDGVVLTTTESLLFEWCRTAEHPQFKEFSRLAKESVSIESGK